MKKMVVSYNLIGSLPQGRHEAGDAIAYSAVAYSFDDNWKLHYYGALWDAIHSKDYQFNVTPEQEAAAEKVLIQLKEALLEDLKVVETVYVYVGGDNATPDALEFVSKLYKLGKQIHIVTCWCKNDAKVNFAKELGIDLMYTKNCDNSREFCGGLFEKLSKIRRQRRRIQR